MEALSMAEVGNHRGPELAEVFIQVPYLLKFYGRLKLIVKRSNLGVFEPRMHKSCAFSKWV